MFHPDYIDLNELIKDKNLTYLFNIINKHGGLLRIVGGAVRDSILGLKRNNIDLVTDLSPLEFTEICIEENIKCTAIGIQFYNIGVTINNNFYKITSLSSELDYMNNEWKDDASKRDFTINAIYADKDGHVFDYYNGIKDLENGVVKFIGNPATNIKNNNIRIMRFFRFCALFGKKIDKKSLESCIKNKHLLKNISIDKIKEELFKIISLPYSFNALKLIYENDILEFLIAPPNYLDNITKINKIKNNLNIASNPIRELFFIYLPDEKRAKRLSELFHLTKEEKDYFIGLSKSKIDYFNFKNNVSINKIIYKYGKDICKDYWLYLNLNNNNLNEIKITYDKIIDTKLPSFPISNNDIKNLKIETKLLNKHLSILKNEWIDSGCVLSKDELLINLNTMLKK